MNNACSGNDKLNKKAFVSMLGASKFIKSNFNPATSLQNKEITRIKKILFDNNGNKLKTAAMLGISLSSLNRKLNNSNFLVEKINDDELKSPNTARIYFENLKSNWQITNFNSLTREVCVNVESRSGNVRLSIKVPNLRN